MIECRADHLNRVSSDESMDTSDPSVSDPHAIAKVIQALTTLNHMCAEGEPLKDTVVEYGATTLIPTILQSQSPHVTLQVCWLH
jgi:hypothetical protein